MKLSSRLTLPMLGLTLLTSVSLIAAQGASCDAALVALWTSASDACVSGPQGYFCTGGTAPSAEPAGPVNGALASVGALVEVAAVDALQSPPLDSSGMGGLMWLRPGSTIPYTGLTLGAVSLRDVTPPEFPAWQSLIVQTTPSPDSCSGAPQSSYVVQSPDGTSVGMVINGVSVSLDGTLVVQTTADQTQFITLSGVANLIVFGQAQPVLTGQQLNVPFAAGDFTQPADYPGLPSVFDPALIANLPVALFARPVILPQPGYVQTQAPVNLRTAPSTEGIVLFQVQAGEVMSVLGQNPTGEWFHVRLDTGETGWMAAELLSRNLGRISAIYEMTPLPPQRFGTLGNSGRILAPAGVNLRSAPDVGFDMIGTLSDGTPVTLLARSPYSPWVKIETGGLTGWVALITLDTDAFIDALPIDYNVPPPPPPTLVPGSFGNAFPDPDGEE